MKTIKNEAEYEKALEEVYQLMSKGEKNVTQAEADQIENMAKAIQAYEKVYYPFPMPKTIEDIIAVKMLEKKLTRTKLAELLGIGNAKLSQILNGKRRPDVAFLKAVHQHLGIDGNLLLEYA